MTAEVVLPKGMDPAYYSLSLLRRRKLEASVAVSTKYLLRGAVSAALQQADSPASSVATVDEQLWCIQTRALILQSWFDDTEIDDDGVDDVLMEGEQAVENTVMRPNTSLRGNARQGTGAGRQNAVSRAGGLGTSGRPVSSRFGYARPGTLNNRPGTLQRSGGGTAMRPITGRLLRMGTASLQAVPGGPHINIQRLNLEKYAREKPMVAKMLCDYLLYVEHKPKLALELCTIALNPKALADTSSGSTAALQEQVGIANANDWWWKSRLAKANYQLGLLREAEKYFKASLFERAATSSAAFAGASRFVNYHTSTVMELGKVYKKMDQPLTAMELFSHSLEENPVDHHILLCQARLYDDLHQPQNAFDLYTQVLRADSSNVEAIACVAAHFFYEKNQPELALRFYRRLLQMGLHTAEVWNNVGLCAFYASQFDFALSCMERALQACQEDQQRADVWYNIGHVGISLGDVKFAERAFKLAVAADSTHAEAINNLAVLALERKKTKEGKKLIDTAVLVAPELVEAVYNAGLMAYQAGELEEANHMMTRALDVYPDHAESVALQSKLREQFLAL